MLLAHWHVDWSHEHLRPLQPQLVDVQVKSLFAPNTPLGMAGQPFFQTYSGLLRQAFTRFEPASVVNANSPVRSRGSGVVHADATSLRDTLNLPPAFTLPRFQTSEPPTTVGVVLTLGLEA